MALTPSKQIELLQKENKNLTEEKRVLTQYSKKIDESINKLERDIKSYKSIGTPSEINQLIVESNKVVDKYRSLEQKYKQLLNESKLLKQYKKLGSIKQITEAFKEAEILLNNYENQIVESLSTKYSIDKNMTRQTIKMCESTGKDPDAYLAQLRPSKVVNKQYSPEIRRSTINESKRLPQKTIKNSLDDRLSRYDRRSNK